MRLLFCFELVLYFKGISLDLIWILFGSRSLLTERDPKEFRTSSEGDPKEYRIKPLCEAARHSQKKAENGHEKGEKRMGKAEKKSCHLQLRARRARALGAEVTRYYLVFRPIGMLIDSTFTTQSEAKSLLILSEDPVIVSLSKELQTKLFTLFR